MTFPLLSRAVCRLALTLALCGAVVPGLALADAYGDVQRLERAGKVGEALSTADAWIEAHPRDPQMRFVKAGVLERSGNMDAAEDLLVQLTRDYPELAEPWNNLAVLHAGQGELERARDALEEAVRIQPDYPTALENLGDVQLRLAQRLYERARKLNSREPRLALKIQMLREMQADASATAR